MVTTNENSWKKRRLTFFSQFFGKKRLLKNYLLLIEVQNSFFEHELLWFEYVVYYLHDDSKLFANHWKSHVTWNIACLNQLAHTNLRTLVTLVFITTATINKILCGNKIISLGGYDSRTHYLMHCCSLNWKITRKNVPFFLN